ncbi:MAG TPA: hypothetical protein VHC22_13395 [Pirellulales bacterium]|nr:hypothetical protein [Pirellulales bacterium]
MTKLGEMDLKTAAKEAAGNWRGFESFAWDRTRELARPEDWTIVYTHHRDSGLLDQSNASAIEEALEPFTEGDDPDVVAERHNHWAVGWIDGFSIGVFRRGRITKAFKTYHELVERMADYPVLDDEDYSRREYEATLENIADSAWRLKHDFDLPEDWEAEVYSWLSDHDSSAIENRDDQGGYPEQAQLERAFAGLGFQRPV